MSFNDPDGRCARRLDAMFCVPKHSPTSKVPPKPTPRRPFHGVAVRAIENNNVRPKSTPNKRAIENQNVRGPNAPVYAGASA